jgi:hypothetical protein
LETLSEKIYIEEVTWDTVRNIFKCTNPEFYQIIEQLSPSKTLTFIKLTYDFGDLILKEGILKLPEKKHQKNSSETDRRFKLQLDYSSIPLLFLMDKSCEIFILENDRVIPLKIFEAGKLFGTFEIINYLFGKSYVPPWYATAGNRSIFMLPKISEKGRLQNLNAHFKLMSNTQAFSLQDHWYLFKQIAQAPNFIEPWSLSLLAFPQHWFSFYKKDPAWYEFYSHLFKEAWSQSQQLRLKDELAIHWQLTLKAMAQRRIQPNPYLTHTLQHLLLIAQKQAPSFSLTENSNLAPIQGLQEAFLEIYGLKKHYPNLMSIQIDNFEKQKIAYYSLAFPTLMTGSLYSKCNTSTLMQDLKILKLSLETLLMDDSFSQKFLNNTQFGFYHVDKDKQEEILPSTDIITLDQSLQKSIPSLEAFCATSTFWRGCITLASSAS